MVRGFSRSSGWRRAETYSVVVPRTGCGAGDQRRSTTASTTRCLASRPMITFSLWPPNDPGFEQIADICAQAVAADASGCALAQSHASSSRKSPGSSPYLAREKWRQIPRSCLCRHVSRLRSRFVRRRTCGSDLPELWLRGAGGGSCRGRKHLPNFSATISCGHERSVEQIVDAVMDFARRTRASSTRCHRAARPHQSVAPPPRPTRPLTAADLNVHNLLSGATKGGFCSTSFPDALDLRIHIGNLGRRSQNDQKSSEFDRILSGRRRLRRKLEA